MNDRRDDPGFLFKGSPGHPPEGQWVPLGVVPDEPAAARPSLIDFLRARLDEAEAAAQAAAEDAGEPDWDVCQAWIGPDDGGGWETVVGPALMRVGGEPAALHIMRYDPGAVLREVDAKRRIVDELAFVLSEAARTGDEREAGLAETTLALLALPAAEHPDYDEEWEP